MNNYIIWRGKDSRDVDGLLITSLPAITKPAMRYEETEIDGRDGSIVEPLGYQSYNRDVGVGLRGEFDIDEVVAFFSGSGPLILSNEEEKEYNAAIFDAVDFDRLLRFRTAVVKFRCQPYKHIAGEPARTLQTSPANVLNAGTVDALPLIYMTGSGSVSVKVNGSEVFRYTFDDAGAVYIDSEKEEAYHGEILKNRNMTGAFPVLPPGGNKIEFSGDISKFDIKVNTRYI